MKTRSRLIKITVLILTMVLCLYLIPANAYAKGEQHLTSAELSGISSGGNVALGASLEDLNNAGFEYGDTVKVSFLDKTVEMPLVSKSSDVDKTKPGIFADDKKVVLGIRSGDFATTYGIAAKTTNSDGSSSWAFTNGSTDPMPVSITMKTKAGYLKAYVMHNLSYTDVRSDYPHLTDEEFANFREVTTTGMRRGILYRTASPINPGHNRSKYADAAIKKAGVTVIMNLADDENTATSYKGYSDTYYSTTKYITLKAGLSFNTEEFREKVARGMKFFAANPGVYAVHCTEGKDRAGMVTAVLECLAGATYDEVIADYMTSFYNYFGVTEDDERYKIIYEGNIVKTLMKAFEVDELETSDLEVEAADYLMDIGLTEEEVEALKSHIKANSIESMHVSLTGTRFIYNGKVQRPEIKTIGGKVLTEGVDYTIEWSRKSSRSAGKYTMTIIGKNKYFGQKVISYRIYKAENPMTISARTLKVSYKKVRYGTQYFDRALAMSLSGSRGKLTYSKVTKNDKIGVYFKTGKFVAKKGIKKGTYKIKVKVTAAGGTNYKSKTEYVNVIVKVG